VLALSIPTVGSQQQSISDGAYWPVRGNVHFWHLSDGFSLSLVSKENEPSGPIDLNDNKKECEQS
jgi:hypothetical protein